MFSFIPARSWFAIASHLLMAKWAVEMDAWIECLILSVFKGHVHAENSVQISRFIKFQGNYLLLIFKEVNIIPVCFCLQFQRRNYAKLKWFKCGKKGYGLQLLEDVSEGQFLIEYVGEVDMLFSINLHDVLLQLSKVLMDLMLMHFF